MAYTTPELLLVGTAQNLVLNDVSLFEHKEQAVFCRLDYPADVDASAQPSYNLPSTW
jgi:hypothetical protein